MNDTGFSGMPYDAAGHRAAVRELLQGGLTTDELLRLGSERKQYSMRLDGADDSPFPQRRGTLSDAQVREIRRRAYGHETQEQIAADYGITQAQVSAIKLRKSYAYIPDALNAVAYLRNRRALIAETAVPHAS